MTCITVVSDGTRCCMACDSQATNNGAVMVLAVSKIQRLGPLLIASEGTMMISQFVRFHSAPPLETGPLNQFVSTTFAPALRAFLREHDAMRKINDKDEFPGMTLIARGPDFVLMDSGGAVVEPLNEWWAIGSGAAEARGAMFVASGQEHGQADQIAIMGVRAAIVLDDGCCNPIRHEWTEP